MKFIYGSYQFDENSVQITSFDRSLLLSDNQRPQFLRVTMALRGKLIRSTQAEIMSDLARMHNALSAPGYDAGFVDNGGSIIPTWFLLNRNTVGGIVVTQPVSHGVVSGAEGTTYLYYTFSLQADFPFHSNSILSFHETVSFNDLDGGPLQVERIPAEGLPILQNVTTCSWYRATQSGNLTQNFSGPQPIPPLWPSLLRRAEGAKQISYTSPKTIRGIPIEFGVSWSYEFVSIAPIGTGADIHVIG